MEKAQRMQQWMMNNPQEAMKFMQAQQAQATELQADIATLEQQSKAAETAWNAVLESYGDSRIAAYKPTEARRKAFAARLNAPYSSAREDLLTPFMGFFQDPSVSPADWGEGETINKAYDEAYQGLCPQWWGANGKVQTFMKTQKDWFIRERIPFLEKGDAPLLQQYATMNTPAATYRSTAELQAVEEYLDLAWKVYRDRDISARCQRPQDCDGTYP
jgi:hypothetical protein